MEKKNVYIYIYIYIFINRVRGCSLVLFDVTEILDVVKYTTLKELTTILRLDIFPSLDGAEKGTT